MACVAPPSLSSPSPSPRISKVNSTTVDNQLLFVSLKTPKAPSQLKTLHGQIIKTGLIHDDVTLGQLLLCCSLSNSIDYARRVFDLIPQPTPFFYNAMIKGYSTTEQPREAIDLYLHMRSQSIPCDSYTFAAVLSSVSLCRCVSLGQEVHGLIIKMGYDAVVLLQTSIIDMYCSCGFASHGRSIFDRVPDKDAICWNTMVSGYVKCSKFSEAQALFDQMPIRNVSSWNTLIGMFCESGDILVARRLFDVMPYKDVISWNLMISGYAKIEDFKTVRLLFDEMPKRNVLSWNLVISCYVQTRKFIEALKLFRLMQVSNVKPNEITVVAMLSVCSHLCELDMGRWIHGYIKRTQMKLDVYINTALLDMYGKCGSIEEAQMVFNDANPKDAFMCSNMIEVLAIHGKAKGAFEVFGYMKDSRLEPNDVTFVALLRACTHVGLVNTGLNVLEMMSKEFGLVPKVEHWGCVIDLLGRSGYLEQAHELIKRMPIKPNPFLWSTLLGACRLHNNVTLAEEVAVKLIELEPENCANYVLLSNIYSKAGRWVEAAKVRKMMKDKGIMKKPGCSLVHLNNSVFEFFNGDRANPLYKEIIKKLEEMFETLKRKGYVPITSSALQDVNVDEREQVLMLHSEKLAVVFGLISSDVQTPIRVVKNLRICDDCHLFMKMVSKYYNRQLVIRDCNRYHHFRDGCCSCSDFW